jgi:predicted porin
MQKKLLAAAVAAACATPAFAQVPAEIQVYGRVNVSVEHITISNSAVAAQNDSTNELVDNSSRIGFRGNKDLGNGLKVIWQVESRVKLDDNDGDSSVFASRDSFAGLQGAFGTIRAGKTIGPVYYATYDYISMHNHDTGTSSDALLDGSVTGNTAFMNNVLWYTSPKLGNFTIDVAYSFGPMSTGETRAAGLTDQPSYLGLVGSYDQGGLHLAASYAQTKNTSLLFGTTGNNDTAMTFGGAYDFKSFVLGGLVEKSEHDNVSGGSDDRTYWRVSGMLPVGKNEFHLNYGIAGDRDLNGVSTNNGAKQYTVAWNHNITKETKVYAFYTVVDNDTAGTYGFRTAGGAGADQKSLAVGVRHNF